METVDVYADISGDVEAKFDTSEFPVNHPSGIPVGKKKTVVGVMKDESCVKIIARFVSMRPKLYIFKEYEGVEVKNVRELKRA